MLKKAFIIGSAMLLVGGTALALIHKGEKKRREAAEGYRSRYDADLSEYMQKYGLWSELSPEEQSLAAGRADTQPGAETPERLANDRWERFAAHADELAAGDPNAASFGNALYGADWQRRLAEQRRKRERMELAATVSIVVVCLGGTVVGGCLVILLSRGLAWVLLKGMGGAQQVLTVAYQRRRQPGVAPAPTGESVSSAGWTVTRNKHGRLCVQEDAALKGPSDPPPDSVEAGPEDTAFRRRSVAPVVARAQIELGPQTCPSSGPAVSQANARSDDTLNTLTELSEQVSAIRQFVACQQTRVDQWQDGWSILRPLCLRIIRCIDNIDDRIVHLSEGDTAGEHLGHVRDELLFALESSGLEQYTPDLNSPYRGQEKYAEAVKDKQPCKDPRRKGTIARVVRPGYQYFVDEEHVKVVRTAQVRLYG